MTYVPKALVVTVDDAWADKCATVFKERGCVVERVGTGSAALRRLRANSFDVVVLDDSLPDLDPIEFGLSVREVSSKPPKLLVGLHRLAALDRIAEPCNVVYAGPPDEALARIPGLLNES